MVLRGLLATGTGVYRHVSGRAPGRVHGCLGRWMSTSEGEPPLGSTKLSFVGNSYQHSSLPGLNLGMRVANPSPQFPATIAHREPTAANDPRVEWKEHFCSEKQAPYYHNLCTNQVSFQIPNGMVTRFPRFYRRSGAHRVDNSGAVFLSHSESEVQNANTASNLSPKQKLAAYGAAGVLWYLIIHNIFLAIVFSSIYFFHVDLVSLARRYGFNVPISNPTDSEEKKHPSFWKTVVLAILLNKLLVPVQVVVTLGTAPKVIKYIQPIAVKVGPKLRFFWSNKTKVVDAKA